MKKVLLSLALLAAVAVNGFAYDWYAGGAFNVATLNGDSAVIVSPEVGYIFSDKIDGGLGFSLDYVNEAAGSVTSYSFIPFVRYKAYTSGAFALYARLDATIYAGDVKPADAVIAVSPVVEYALSDRFTLWTVLGAASYVSGGASDGLFDIGLDFNNLTIGVAYNF
ncbi:hypothetical protein [Endomicrobium proavitum]|uniref:Glutamine transporter n=1 Tax=Endomicrobium proavitum TaxID=1408281 RepID=A0A0G3WIA7_9BACT|nr:hypothetical protein [Endomicrobium proavitum]AKL97602.1 glutamine transporter [Endomicrobium proavitum]